MAKTIFSGIQPSGNLQLGNYLGSVANWLILQEEQRSIFGVMNWHAITVPQNPEELAGNILECVTIYLAAGINPKKSIIFVQSEVKEHLELAWVFACLTPLGWLNRMTQFKEKADRKDENNNLGLYSYPALMAADILLYKADLVPVGNDQKQHVELTRDIALAFNRRYNCDYFKAPEALILEGSARIMSLLDGTKKMSKSDPSDYSRINLTDAPELISKKIKKCKTDSASHISYEPERPEIYNLLNIFAACTGEKPQAIASRYNSLGFAKFKEGLAEAIIAKLQPIQCKSLDLKNHPDYVWQVLKEGKEKATSLASAHMQEIKKIIGLL